MGNTVQPICAEAEDGAARPCVMIEHVVPTRGPKLILHAQIHSQYTYVSSTAQCKDVGPAAIAGILSVGPVLHCLRTGSSPETMASA